jgi:imidazole glycerol-phosphate synthase subunit HisF
VEVVLGVRIIPRLDIKGPNVVKGLSFDGYRALGTPEQLARKYYEDGADELIYQDAVASLYQRNSLSDIVSKTASEIFIPLTVVGGLRSVDDIRSILRAGADKVGINTAAVANPDFIKAASRTFGSQCIVLSIEAKRRSPGKWEVWVDYGRQPTGLDVLEWVARGVELGAGEVLLTSVDNDGMGIGYDLELVKTVTELVPVPVIASGGAGSKNDVVKMAVEANPDAISAASIFHYNYMEPPESMYMSSNPEGLRMGEHIDEGNIDFLQTGECAGLPWEMIDSASIPEVKNLLAENGITCRPASNGAIVDAASAMTGIAQ